MSDYPRFDLNWPETADGLPRWADLVRAEIERLHPGDPLTDDEEIALRIKAGCGTEGFIEYGTNGDMRIVRVSRDGTQIRLATGKRLDRIVRTGPEFITNRLRTHYVYGRRLFECAIARILEHPREVDGGTKYHKLVCLLSDADIVDRLGLGSTPRWRYYFGKACDMSMIDFTYGHVEPLMAITSACRSLGFTCGWLASGGWSRKSGAYEVGIHPALFKTLVDFAAAGPAR